MMSRLPTFDLAEIDKAEEQAEIDRQRAEEMGRAIQSAIAYLERAKGASREALEGEPIKGRLLEARTLLEQHRLDEVPAVRRKVWQAILEFELTRPLDPPEVRELISDLVRRGFLQEEAEGPIRAYGKGYKISPESLFGAPEIADVKSLTGKLVFQAQQAFQKELVQKGVLSWKDVLAGKTGPWSAVVPESTERKNGTLIKHLGGVIYCEVTSTAVFPKQNSGAFHIAPVMLTDGRQKRAVGIITKSLTAGKPVFTEYISDRTQLGYMHFAWELLRRAVSAEEEVERMRPIKDQFAAKAPLSREELVLAGTPGTAYIEHDGAWEVLKGEELVALIHHLFLLVERREEEGAKKIRIVDVPDHLKDFFAPCMGEYTERGDRFEGVAQPLKMVLQAVWKQAYSAIKDAEKAEQITP